MGRELQKKKRRSGRAPVKMSNKPKNPLNPRGNSIIAKNWNKKETLAQNYRRLGLVSRLKAPTGGTEKKVLEFEEDPEKRANQTKGNTPFGITPVNKAVISEARVERDEDGNIIRVIHAADPNPLNDPLNDIDTPSAAAAQHDPTHQHTLHGTASLENADGTTDVVRSLLEQSAGSTGEGKKKRHQSEREREWLAKLVGRHGDDYGAMARDIKLNPMQQTAGDIKRRVQRMNAA
ncbi:ribosome biogenesis protein nop16 domain-containing protein [Sarocladium implicatum]|nr:ribosome biogenesis protein nop16 domain-containing protein [Sarocladium implicatum]